MELIVKRKIIQIRALVRKVAMIEKKKTISKAKASENRLSLLFDYVKRGEKSCKEAAANQQNPQPLRSYYMGKATSFNEVIGFLEAFENEE